MHRSSESVAALAAALAKAQAELVNPEKSLTAVIQTGRAGEGSRTFRYAPLSSGLDVVRKTLGQHEIATVQTTAVDQAAGIINLTTLLAHASGEWIASDWPVCAVAEMAIPQRMGAALTYARRYALFTLVGIAGEDDLDCPDLQGDLGSISGPSVAPQAERARIPSGRGIHGPAQGRTKGSTSVLGPEESAALRGKLLAEVDQLRSTDSASTWAQSALAHKNRLNGGDARVLENVFEQKIRELAGEFSSEPSPGRNTEPTDRIRQDAATPGASKGGADRPRRVDKSVLAVAGPRRYRYPEHLRFVAQQPCLVCGRKPPIRTTCASCSRGRLAGRLATNSRCRSVGDTIVRLTASPRSRTGGRRSASTRSRSRARFGSKHALNQGPPTVPRISIRSMKPKSADSLIAPEVGQPGTAAQEIQLSRRVKFVAQLSS